MRQSMRVGVVLLLLVGVLGVLQPAFGQEVTAGIVGTVTDPSGAPLKDATVAATDTERGVTLTTKTNDSGAYNITRVPVGNYSVKISAPGFQTAVHTGIVLVLNQTARIDMQMKIGPGFGDGGSHWLGPGPSDRTDGSRAPSSTPTPTKPSAGHAQLCPVDPAGARALSLRIQGASTTATIPPVAEAVHQRKPGAGQQLHSGRHGQ